MLKLLPLIFFIASPAVANTVSPKFTQGSMQSTTTTSVDITRTIAQEIYGGSHKSWSGTNITPSGNINDASTTFSVTDANEAFQLEIVERSAGLIETIDITEDIVQSSTTSSLSVFSQ